jgi:hypothetical protein
MNNKKTPRQTPHRKTKKSVPTFREANFLHPITIGTLTNNDVSYLYCQAYPDYSTINDTILTK